MHHFINVKTRLMIWVGFSRIAGPASRKKTTVRVSVIAKIQ
jgi:hypothetical protein